jgi:hypothetical protein
MTTRSTSRMVTFQHAFVLDGFARQVPAGTYLVETEETLMDSVLSLAWKRASTIMRLPTATGSQDVFVDPEQLNAALLRDRSLENPQPSDTRALPKAPVGNGAPKVIGQPSRQT